MESQDKPQSKPEQTGSNLHAKRKFGLRLAGVVLTGFLVLAVSNGVYRAAHNNAVPIRAVPVSTEPSTLKVSSGPTAQVETIPTPQSTTQTQTNTPVSSTTSQKTYMPYVAPVCTKTPVSYKTEYVNVTYLPVGQTSEFGGHDGYTETCTASSNGYKPADVTYPPFDKTVYVGTGSTGTTPATGATYTQAQALQIAQSNCSALSNTGSYQTCISAYLRKFGY